jgi:hypothetical protein
MKTTLHNRDCFVINSPSLAEEWVKIGQEDIKSCPLEGAFVPVT